MKLINLIFAPNSVWFAAAIGKIKSLNGTTATVQEFNILSNLCCFVFLGMILQSRNLQQRSIQGERAHDIKPWSRGCYREFIRFENYALIYLRWNFCEMTINDNKAILKIWLLSVNIINLKEILLMFLILRRSHMNEVRLQNLYPSHTRAVTSAATSRARY